jgi:excisionase family DNA binding protein
MRSTSEQFSRGPDSRICVTRAKAAELLSISVDSLDRLIAAGEIPTIRKGRIVLLTVRALQAWSDRESARRVGP